MISGPLDPTGLKGSFHFTIPLPIRACKWLFAIILHNILLLLKLILIAAGGPTAPVPRYHPVSTIAPSGQYELVP
jgi:hypothetical protein